MFGCGGVRERGEHREEKRQERRSEGEENSLAFNSFYGEQSNVMLLAFLAGISN